VEWFVMVEMVVELKEFKVMEAYREIPRLAHGLRYPMWTVNGEVEKILRSDGEQNMGINEDVKGIPGIVLQTLIDTVTGTFNAVQTLLCMQGRVLLWKVRILQKLIGKGMSHGGGNLGG